MKSGSDEEQALAGDIDAQIGIYGYATPFQGIGGRIRARYGDFKVEELLDPETLSGLSDTPDPQHRYPVYLMIKEGIDTLHALNYVKRQLKSGVTYLGLKDARAHTAQYIGLRKPRADTPKELKITNKVSLKLAGYHHSLLTRRSLAGNHFTVKITETTGDTEALKSAETDLRQAVEEMKIPNFYGYQRFGSKRPVTHLVGREVVKGRFQDAVNTLLTHPSPWEDPETVEARREMTDPEKYPSLLKRLNYNLDIERSMISTLTEHPGDWLKALRSIQLPLRRLFVNSYQSYIFNGAASQALREGLSLSEVEAGDIYGEVDTTTGGIRGINKAPTRLEQSTTLPLIQLVGYAYRGGEGRFDRIIQSILEEEGVSPKQFYVKQMPEVSVEGGFRTAPLIVRGLEFEAGGPSDERSCTLKFTLLKGSYATVLLREVMKPLDPVESNL